MSKVQVDTIDTRSGTATMTIGSTNTTTVSIPKAITLGANGTTVTIPSGATITNSGTATGFGGANTPSFHVLKNAVQSINNATSTLITWQTETWDTDNKFSSNRFTPGEAGKYFIYFACVVDELDDGKFIWAQIKKNGSLLLTGQNGQSYFSSLTSYVAGAVDLGASDYVEAYAQQNNGNARNVVSGTNPGSFFGGYKIIT